MHLFLRESIKVIIVLTNLLSLLLIFLLHASFNFFISVGWLFRSSSVMVLSNFFKNLMQTKREKFKLYLLGNLFAIKKRRKKRPWNTSNMWLKFAQIEGIFFRINYRIRGPFHWKHQLSHSYRFTRLVCRAKDKNKTNT